MRIVGGKYGGRIIKGPRTDSSRTRPTSDRVRESLFNIISPQIKQAAFLDLYAGTGAVGIEALSRGAKSLFAVEKDRHLVQVIKENLASLGEEAVILPFDVFRAINELHKKGLLFDLVFADPPYHLMVASKLTELVEPLMVEGGLFIVEHSISEVINQNKLEELKHYNYGDSVISLYRRRYQL